MLRISIAEYVSASDLNPDIIPAPGGSRQLPRRGSREFVPSPLLGSHIALSNSNTIVHDSQSTPNIRLESNIMSENSIAPKRGRGRAKKNPILDEVSLNFSHDSLELLNEMVDKIITDDQPPTSTELEDQNDIPSTSKAQQPKGRKKKETVKKSESLERLPGSNTSLSSPKNIKQSDLLESMRLMINKTVGDAVESATKKLHYDLQTMQATFNVQIAKMSDKETVGIAVEAATKKLQEDLQAMQVTFNVQIAKMSDKETRHHLESQFTAKEDKDSITAKLTGLEELKPKIQEIQNKMESRLNEMETRLESFQNFHDERCTAIEITEERHFGATMDRLTGLENSQRNLSKTFAESNSQFETWQSKITDLESTMKEAKLNISQLEEKMTRLNSLPPDLEKLNEEMADKKDGLQDLMVKAESLIEKLSNGETQNADFDRVKSNTESNTICLDKIQKDEKMMNLLVSNLPPALQTIQGFGQFALNEFNVELTPGDVMSINKVFESTNRLVHLVRFRNCCLPRENKPGISLLNLD